MDAEWTIWGAVIAATVAMLAIDLRYGPGEGSSLRSAVTWSVAWIVVGVAVAVPIWALRGDTAAGEYVTGYAIERSLSLDNVFVFAVIFAALAVPAALRPPALTFGIGAALVLRALFIAAGAALLAAASWVVYPLGAFLILTGIHLTRRSDAGADGTKVLSIVRRVLPLSDGYSGRALWRRDGGRLLATPLAAALLALALADLAFAVDSIPAVFAVTRDPLVVFAANATALAGLRPLYVVLEAMRSRFEYLHIGLGAVLVVVGAKMALADVYHLPAWASLLIVLGILAAAVIASLRVAPPVHPYRERQLQ
jgi:tellurite resistance protein TerC